MRKLKIWQSTMGDIFFTAKTTIIIIDFFSRSHGFQLMVNHSKLKQSQ